MDRFARPKEERIKVIANLNDISDGEPRPLRKWLLDYVDGGSYPISFAVVAGGITFDAAAPAEPTVPPAVMSTWMYDIAKDEVTRTPDQSAAGSSLALVHQGKSTWVLKRATNGVELVEKTAQESRSVTTVTIPAYQAERLTVLSKGIAFVLGEHRRGHTVWRPCLIQGGKNVIPEAVEHGGSVGRFFEWKSDTYYLMPGRPGVVYQIAQDGMVAEKRREKPRKKAARSDDPPVTLDDMLSVDGILYLLGTDDDGKAGIWDWSSPDQERLATFQCTNPTDLVAYKTGLAFIANYSPNHWCVAAWASNVPESMEPVEDADERPTRLISNSHNGTWRMLFSARHDKYNVEPWRSRQ